MTSSQLSTFFYRRTPNHVLKLLTFMLGLLKSIKAISTISYRHAHRPTWPGQSFIKTLFLGDSRLCQDDVTCSNGETELKGLHPPGSNDWMSRLFAGICHTYVVYYDLLEHQETGWWNVLYLGAWVYLSTKTQSAFHIHAYFHMHSAQFSSFCDVGSKKLFTRTFDKSACFSLNLSLFPS